MPTRLFESIVSRWDDQTLDTTFPGGLWFGEAPEEESGTKLVFPHVTMLSLGDNNDFWTSDGQFRLQGVQFSIFYKEDGSTDPLSELGTLMRALDAAMLFAPLASPSAEGFFCEFRRTRQDIFLDDTELRVWQGQLDYQARRFKPVDYNPS